MIRPQNKSCTLNLSLILYAYIILSFAPCNFRVSSNIYFSKGQNIKLASRLLDLEIDVFRELDEGQEEDVDIEEFSDEIESWIIDELKRIGLDTAKAVLDLDKEDLIKRADLEESTIDEVISTLKKEFE